MVSPKVPTTVKKLLPFPRRVGKSTVVPPLSTAETSAPPVAVPGPVTAALKMKSPKVPPGTVNVMLVPPWMFVFPGPVSLACPIP